MTVLERESVNPTKKKNYTSANNEKRRNRARKVICRAKLLKLHITHCESTLMKFSSIFFYPLFNGKMHSADKIVESENISANTTRQVVLKLNFSREKKTIVFRQTLYSATEDLTSE